MVDPDYNLYRLERREDVQTVRSQLNKTAIESMKTTTFSSTALEGAGSSELAGMVYEFLCMNLTERPERGVKTTDLRQAFIASGRTTSPIPYGQFVGILRSLGGAVGIRLSQEFLFGVVWSDSAPHRQDGMSKFRMVQTRASNLSLKAMPCDRGQLTPKVSTPCVISISRVANGRVGVAKNRPRTGWLLSSMTSAEAIEGVLMGYEPNDTVVLIQEIKNTTDIIAALRKAGYMVHPVIKRPGQASQAEIERVWGRDRRVAGLTREAFELARRYTLNQSSMHSALP